MISWKSTDCCDLTQSEIQQIIIFRLKTLQCTYHNETRCFVEFRRSKRVYMDRKEEKEIQNKKITILFSKARSSGVLNIITLSWNRSQICIFFSLTSKNNLGTVRWLRHQRAGFASLMIWVRSPKPTYAIPPPSIQCKRTKNKTLNSTSMKGLNWHWPTEVYRHPRTIPRDNSASLAIMHVRVDAVARMPVRLTSEYWQEHAQRLSSDRSMCPPARAQPHIHCVSPTNTRRQRIYV